MVAKKKSKELEVKIGNHNGSYKYIILEDNENNMYRNWNLWHLVLDCLERDLVMNKTNERIPKELEMTEQFEKKTIK